jgi:hypothetical protein
MWKKTKGAQQLNSTRIYTLQNFLLTAEKKTSFVAFHYPRLPSHCNIATITAITINSSNIVVIKCNVVTVQCAK